VPGGTPKVNWGHPLARDLRVAVLHGRLAPWTVEQITPNGYSLVPAGNSLSWGNASRCYSPKYGTGLSISGGMGAATPPDYPAVATNVSSTTVFIGKLATSGPAASLASVVNNFGNGYGIDEAVGGVAGNIRLSSYIGSLLTSPTTVTVDTTNVHCFAAINAGTGASNTIKLLVDGVLRDTWSTGANPNFAGTRFNWSVITGGSPHQYVSMIFARELSVVELLSLQENPYQIFQTYQQPLVSSPTITYQARITWAEAQYQASGAPPTVTDYSEPLSRGIFRGIERGVA